MIHFFKLTNFIILAPSAKVTEITSSTSTLADKRLHADFYHFDSRRFIFQRNSHRCCYIKYYILLSQQDTGPYN